MRGHVQAWLATYASSSIVENGNNNSCYRGASSVVSVKFALSVFAFKEACWTLRVLCVRVCVCLRVVVCVCVCVDGRGGVWGRGGGLGGRRIVGKRRGGGMGGGGGG